MSCKCVGCGFTVAQPDSLWYACTKYSPYTVFLCGTCVSVIPDCARRRDLEGNEFKILFGVQYADIGSFGKYQLIGSSQGPIRFWVEKEDIERHIPESEKVLAQLYPYYCPEEYLEEVSKMELTGDVIFEKGVFLGYIKRPGRHWLRY